MKKNIIIVEDSAYFRTTLVEELSKFDDITVVGTANDGISAVKLFAEKKPDVVILDLVLPKMTGDAVTEAIMAIDPTPIILITSLSDFEIEKSFHLNLNYFVEIIKKPLEITSEFIERLRYKIRYAAPLNKNYSKDFSLTRPKFRKNLESRKVLVLGSSTGGPKLLKTIIPSISKLEKLSVIIANHIEVGFENSFKNWLQSLSKKNVYVISDNMEIKNSIYIAPTTNNFIIDNNLFKLTPINQKQMYFPSIDKVYESVAKHFREKCIIFQMTGMGFDGKEGVKIAKEFGAKILAQNPNTAIAPSMPKSALLYADNIINPEEIIPYIENE
ncbi:chemotaxis protein CheB [Deferribacter autotrophicus]|uniref:protein-glutamate methylesterase n=1 Tax=Deferribacter autotrophicus TaxID=500465 RepID=A0A5A8F5I9_9BACT|nr:chemotaxis protein CheB [Deferribacter autotrophicus]KAA0258960.1 chemotaxis protein CheB [Deferribacter autotrophicus]